MNRAVAAVVAGIFFIFLLSVFLQSDLPVDYTSPDYRYVHPESGKVENETVPEHYVREAKNETGAVNAVTSIVVLYRGFDTLGEVTVLFSAATGVAFVLHRMRFSSRGKNREPNFIVSTGASVVLPFILIVGAYVFVHGHLTPGGGFPGGAIIASGVALLLISYPDVFMNERRTSVIESLAGLAFAITGLVGIIAGLQFLENFLPLGTAGTVLSAGIIPVIYVAIGFKVGSELSAIVNHLKGGGEK